MNFEALDLPAWVAKAPPNKRYFREAVHIVLTAIGSSCALRSTMVMKGGLLLAIRYDSTRFTKDADFSTQKKYEEADASALLDELDQQIDLANQQMQYDTICLRRSSPIGGGARRHCQGPRHDSASSRHWPIPGKPLQEPIGRAGTERRYAVQGHSCIGI